MENNTKYIYSAYGKEFKENMNFLKEQGVNDKIEELADLAFELIKNENVDRTQLEMYVCNNFKFSLLKKTLAEPAFVEEVNNGEDKKNGKWNKIHVQSGWSG